jgi:pimeloyl-ACP methyl ester carboxylesterase
MLRRLVLPVVSTLLALWSTAAMPADRVREIVTYDDVQLELIAEGSGPLIVLLPGRGRGSEDFDEVALGLAKAGFRVLRPQPRGIGASAGPMKDLTLHDLARDIAEVIKHENAGPAVIVGHAFGSWVARMTAVDDPQLVRGVVMAGAAAKAYPAGFDGAKELSDAVRRSGDPTRPEEERIRYLRTFFFAPGSDANVWLTGSDPAVDAAQFAAGRATPQSVWWGGGSAPLLDLQGELDPFKPRSMANEMRDEFGERATVVVIPNASHALIPEQPAAVVDAIVAWIGKLPKQP